MQGPWGSVEGSRPSHRTDGTRQQEERQRRWLGEEALSVRKVLKVGVTGTGLCLKKDLTLVFMKRKDVWEAVGCRADRQVGLQTGKAAGTRWRRRRWKDMDRAEIFWR